MEVLQIIRGNLVEFIFWFFVPLKELIYLISVRAISQILDINMWYFRYHDKPN